MPITPRVTGTCPYGTSIPYGHIILHSVRAVKAKATFSFAKECSMSKPKKHFPKPNWINDVPNSVIPRAVKKLYRYTCPFGPHTCWLYNRRLGKKTDYSQATMKRAVRWGRNNRLWWITSGGGSHRRIHLRYYESFLDWLTSLALPTRSSAAFHQFGPLKIKDLNESRNRNLKSLGF